ncbi:hypothetical protein PVAP13_8KG224801 [Panicum virgatum]|uniref:Uncharacterized protein n=1 Tax=Panicum virgatum TaxID=38727 RepID=A0A8T0PI38_PANVG|nr:hypothetical protein PVAP13_8KG224801 [Panicum virgatum]
MKTASAKSGRKAMASSSRLLVRRERERYEGIRGLMETGHALISRRSRDGQAEMDGLGGLGLKTTAQAGFPVLAS